jgi:hypothetical protein
MTWQFLFFANLTLLLRVRLLLTDAPVTADRWWAKAAVECVALPILLTFGIGQGGAIAASLLFNAAAVLVDRRARDRNLLHLVLGLLHLLALSFCLGPSGAVEIRPGLINALSAMIGQSAIGSAAQIIVGQRGLRFLLGLLLVANEANLFIRWWLNRLQLRPGSPNVRIDTTEYARGRVIGLLERMLIFFFVLHGQYGAVGFTLAAKGFTRFKELENRGFAEYVLIGTLLSSGLAMLLAVAMRALA